MQIHTNTLKYLQTHVIESNPPQIREQPPPPSTRVRGVCGGAQGQLSRISISITHSPPAAVPDMGGRSAKGNEVMLVVPLTCIALLSGSGDAANSRISTIARTTTSRRAQTAGLLCTNVCSYQGDGDCEDGGPGAEYTCAYGPDCTDCGPRVPSPPAPPAAPLCNFLAMTASSGSRWQLYNGAVWELVRSHYTHYFGGSGLSGRYLYYLNGRWRIGSDVTSTTMYAYVPTISSTPVGIPGWLVYNGGAWSAVDITVSVAGDCSSSTLPPQPPATPPLPPSPPPPPAAPLCNFLEMTASSGSRWQLYNGAVWELVRSHYAHYFGGSGLSGRYLYYLNGRWRIGPDVTSTAAWAYVLTTSPTPVGIPPGWLVYSGNGWSAVDITVSVAGDCSSSTLPPQPPATPRWVPGVKCEVYRQACPLTPSGSYVDPACPDRHDECRGLVDLPGNVMTPMGV
jgi:hypothetical protein